MSTALITGCDYGIGFEFARQYAGEGWRVHAVCLDEASREKVAALGDAVQFHELDVSDEAGVKALAESLKGEAIDLLINNAATFAPDGPGTLMLPDLDEFTRVMRVNAVAPVYVAAAFEDHVAASERRLMVFLGTRSGSIGDNGSGGHYAYRCSKAALNMAVKSISIDFAPRGIVAAVLHPGSVATETRKGGQIPVGESVSGMRQVIDGLTPEASGTFQRYDGGTIEW
jgi:NAD(P)-dependent dehydrogenase (short-subunit alcohol dehydrogenase family)